MYLCRRLLRLLLIISGCASEGVGRIAAEDKNVPLPPIDFPRQQRDAAPLPADGESLPADGALPPSADSLPPFAEINREIIDSPNWIVMHNQTYTLNETGGNVHACKNFYFPIQAGFARKSFSLSVFGRSVYLSRRGLVRMRLDYIRLATD